MNVGTRHPVLGWKIGRWRESSNPDYHGRVIAALCSKLSFGESGLQVHAKTVLVVLQFANDIGISQVEVEFLVAKNLLVCCTRMEHVCLP